MKQSKLESLFEVCSKTAFGFFTALALWTFVVNPLYGFNVNFWTGSVSITLIFTVRSIVFGYLWRRFFNAGYNRIIKKYVIKGVEWNLNHFRK